MPFIRNLWYVAAWSDELDMSGPIGRVIAGEPIVFYRKPDGALVALEDRCPHRHAPLSLGRVEGAGLRCMYHGLTFREDGMCTGGPGPTVVPPGTAARAFPVVERWDWIWVWTGDPALADPAAIPQVHDPDDDDWVMRRDAIDYAADYQLIHDNLCDLSHLDFTHETTLGAATGSKWADGEPGITALADGLLFERWFEDHVLTPGQDTRADSRKSWRFILPGLFLMDTRAYPVGTARASGFDRPNAEPIFRRREQQAVTPVGEGRSRYLYATGVETRNATPVGLSGRVDVIAAAFAEDKRMIEAQQRIWDLTPSDRKKLFLPQDKAPAQFRRLVDRRLALEHPADAR